MVTELNQKLEESLEQNAFNITNIVDKRSTNNFHALNRGRCLEDLPLVLRVDDLMEVLSIGRNTAYELIRSGKIRSVRIGTNYRVPRDALAEYLAKR